MENDHVNKPTIWINYEQDLLPETILEVNNLSKIPIEIVFTDRREKSTHCSKFKLLT